MLQTVIASAVLAAVHTVEKDSSGSFSSIQGCVDAANEGDTCKVGTGVWKEEVVSSKGITIEGSGPEQTKFDGTETVPDNWKLWKGDIYVQELPPSLHFDTQELFVDNTFITEARWPNAKLEDMLNVTKAWNTVARGTVYGRIFDPELNKTGIDWNGAIATMNLDKRVLSFTRTVVNYSASTNTFNYQIPLQGEKNRTEGQYVGSRYFLSGILAALDAPGEWYLDTNEWKLYIWTPDSKPPGSRVSMKMRDLCFLGTQKSGPLSVASASFFGCTFTMQNCTGCSATDLVLTYPSYTRRIEFSEIPSGPMPNITMMHGNGNTISKISLKYSNHGGILVIGSNNTIEDALVVSTDWLGTLDFPPIQIGFGPSNCGKGIDDSPTNEIAPFIKDLKHCGHWLGGTPDKLTAVMGTNNVIRHVTVTEFGNSGIVTSQLSCEVSYAHVSMGGMIGCDHAGIHADNLPTPCMYKAGSSNCTKSFHHNVVHDCREKCMRGDDASLNITMHNNIVYNCGTPNRDPLCGQAAAGVILKGDYHLLYDITIFNVSTERSQGEFVPFTSKGPPPPACGRPTTPPCVPQNIHSTFFNIASKEIDTKGGPPLNQTASFTGAILEIQLPEMELEDPENGNFAPKSTSPMYMKGISHGAVKSKNVGAIQPDEPSWKAGCISFPEC
eukprot:TRINITY_DN15659_c1_g1_i2.p1 TRINITY_DN15659_c1_g1~~TRINITY_DN15659_c1_g1_i2.p1  ORF type:complete len:668 (+),score=92.58 TRINITY_DN15659_c1_g1_i2:78-2081(+)